MKRILSLTIGLTLLSSFVVQAQTTPVQKLSRGIVNIITSPIEVPKQARAYWIIGAQKTPHILVWIGSGAVWGFVQGIKRIGSGFWDVVSFPFAKPAEYQPLFKPSFVFQEWPKNPKSGR